MKKTLASALGNFSNEIKSTHAFILDDTNSIRLINLLGPALSIKFTAINSNLKTGYLIIRFNDESIAPTKSDFLKADIKDLNYTATEAFHIRDKNNFQEKIERNFGPLITF